jgi:hypothetical protein
VPANIISRLRGFFLERRALINQIERRGLQQLKNNHHDDLSRFPLLVSPALFSETNSARSSFPKLFSGNLKQSSSIT